MGFFDGVGAALLGGGLDLLAGSKTNQANQDASRENIAAQGANQEKALNALQSNDAFGSITRNAQGGFDRTQAGGADAAGARATLAAGDNQLRAPAINAADKNFKFTLPTLDDARGVIQRDQASKRNSFDKYVTDAMSASNRAGGGMGNAPHAATLIEAIGRAHDEFRFNDEQDAMDLRYKTNNNDIALKEALKNSFAMKAPAPGFASGTPGATASTNIAQSPPPASIVDLGGAIPFAAGSNALSQYVSQQNAAESNKQFLDALTRMAGNQNNGGNPTYNYGYGTGGADT